MIDRLRERCITYLVAGLDRGDSFSHRLHDAARFVSEDGREHALGVLAKTQGGIIAAHATVQIRRMQRKTRVGERRYI